MAKTTPDKNLYQVVLLTNDQAFFGKLHGINGRAPYLTDVYYLKPASQATDANGKLLNSNDNYSVIKRGSEIHGPTDKLFLNRSNILYWENVGQDSLVSKGIKADKEVKSTGKAPANVPTVNTTIPPAATDAATGTPVIK